MASFSHGKSCGAPLWPRKHRIVLWLLLIVTILGFAAGIPLLELLRANAGLPELTVSVDASAKMLCPVSLGRPRRG